MKNTAQLKKNKKKKRDNTMNYNKEHSQHTRQCKAIRALHGLTEKDISELVGVGQATVYRYEREMIKDTPAASKLNYFYKTLYALEVSANELD